MKRKRKTPYKKAKDEAWNACSRYVRLRDCLKTTGTRAEGICCTCGTRFAFKDLQAGHYLDGRGNSILFDVRGIHAQCYQCNGYKHGNKENYEVFMRKNYSQKTLDHLRYLKGQKKKFTIYELEHIRDMFNEDYIELLEN